MPLPAGVRLWASLAVVATVACDGDGESVGPRPGDSESFVWSGTVAPGARIEIKGINGAIEASPAIGDEVEVSAVKRGESDDPATVTIEVVRHDGGVTLCAVYPDVPGEPANRCLPGDRGTMNVRDNDVEVEFTVLVPAGVEFRGLTVNGGVEAHGLESNAFAGTVNGSVIVTTTRLGAAFTVNGSVRASIGQPTWDRDLAFTTVNGDVSVAIPANTDAEARLSTVNGEVSSEFPLEEVTPVLLRGTLGAGGPRLTLSAVNGDVTLGRR